MATTSFLNGSNNNGSTIDSGEQINRQLLKQLNCAKIENDVLKQKVFTLTTLCEHHKSKYEQIQSELRYEFGEKEQQYITKINELHQQIKHEKQKLDTMQNKLQRSQQQSNNKDNIHHKNVEALHFKVHHYQNNVEQIKKHYSIKTEEIEALNTKLMQKDSEIAELHKQLRKTYEQYKFTLYRGFQSPSTLKVAKSASFSYFEPSEATMLSPVDETSMILVNNNDISPIPSMSANTHYQMQLMQRMKKYNKSSKAQNVKWSDRIQDSKPTPIDTLIDGGIIKHNYNYGTSDEETDDDLIATFNNKPPLRPFRSTSLGQIGVTPFVTQQNVNNMRKKEHLTAQEIGDAINYVYPKYQLEKSYSHGSSSYESNRKQSSSICLIKNSETQSADVDTVEEMENN